MLPGAINFSRPGLSANFNDGSGINLSSSSSLNISAGYVGIYAGDITIKAKSKLEAKKGESSFISLENDFYNNAGIVMENGSDKASNGAFDDDPQKGAAEAKKAKAAMESAVKVALAAVVGAVKGAMGKIGECLAGIVENQKGNVESQTNSNKSGEKSLLDSNNISDSLNLYSNKPWMNVDSNIKLPDNECYIGPANENALPIVSDELTMTEYDPYMKDFKDGMYVQNRAPDNRYYLGTITYNSDLNMAIYKPTDKKGFEQAKLEQDKKDIRTIASFAADWTPADVAIDSASFIAGHDIITGEECNRGILAAGILLPGGLDSLVKGLAKKGVKQASKHGDDVAEEAFKIGDDVTKTSYVKSSEISEKAIKSIKKKWGQKGVDAFEKAMNKGIVGAEGQNGIKPLKGKPYKGKYTHEIKVKNKEYGDFRIYGYKDSSGKMIFECFDKGLH